jgi:FlaA1/EpsC-like NDP-sugar epimerase
MKETCNKALEILRNKALEIFHRYYLPKWMVFASDGIAVALAFYLAYLLRFNFITTEFDLNAIFEQMLIVFCTYSVFSISFRVHTGLIRHTTIIDIFLVFLSTSLATILLLILSFVSRSFNWHGVMTLPYSIILIHFVLITLWMFFIRIIIKIFYQLITVSFIEKKKVMIFGAGAMGVIAKRILQSDVKSNYQIAGFLDNNKKLHGTKLNGITVYNPRIIHTSYLKKRNISTIIFAIKDISPQEKGEIIRSVLDVGLEVMQILDVETLFNGHRNELSKVRLEDLLGRDPIELNLNRIGEGLSGKTIIVTGAAGSIGSEIVRQLTSFKVKKLILIDQAETPMFHLENELTPLSTAVHFVLADITHKEKLENIFSAYNPGIIFHAAAYKHVPLIENNPHEAIRVNVGGTKNLMELSLKYNVEKFVMISTDKAVNPTNVMGASKRLCELVVQTLAENKNKNNGTQFVITRFGNVLGSNGSVIPLFTKQIESGGPVTITHPDVTRYFMTIPEACHLVLEAGFMCKGGEIFEFDMGKPVKIADLARQMIRLSGLVPEKDIKIVFTGLRPGEKLYEELLSDNERTLPTHNPKIKIAIAENLNSGEILAKINKLLSELYTFSEHEVVKNIGDLVPEYKSNNAKYFPK